MLAGLKGKPQGKPLFLGGGTAGGSQKKPSFDGLPANPLNDFPCGYTESGFEPEVCVLDTRATSWLSPHINAIGKTQNGEHYLFVFLRGGGGGVETETTGNTIYIYIYMSVFFFEGSVTEPRRTFVADLVTDLCNKTSWLVTHPSLHTLVTHPRYTPSLYTPSLHTSDEQTGPVS